MEISIVINKLKEIQLFRYVQLETDEALLLPRAESALEKYHHQVIEARYLCYGVCTH